MSLEKYLNKAAYDAATKSTTESTVAVIADGTGVLVNGVNVIVENPSIGDILFIDANGYKRWIKCDTFVASALPTGCTTVGVCYKRAGSKCYVVNKNNSAKKWSNIFAWKITGFNTDSVATTVTFTMTESTFNSTFTYTASSIDEFVAQLNTYFSTSSNFANDWLKNGKFTAVQYDGEVTLYCYNFYTYQQEYLGASGLTLTVDVGSEVGVISWGVRNNRAQSWGGMNFPRFYEYVYSNGRTPTSNEGLSIDAWPVTYKAFSTSDYCVTLRTTYGDYATYVKSCMLIYPYKRGVMSLSDGKSMTKKLALVTYTDENSSESYKYPAAKYCYDTNYTCNGGDLGVGSWWLPSPPELGELMKNLNYGISGTTSINCDKVNRSLAKIGNTISVSSYAWSCARYGWDKAGGRFSNVGGFGSSDFANSLSAVPVTLLNINN